MFATWNSRLPGGARCTTPRREWVVPPPQGRKGSIWQQPFSGSAPGCSSDGRVLKGLGVGLLIGPDSLSGMDVYKVCRVLKFIDESEGLMGVSIVFVNKWSRDRVWSRWMKRVFWLSDCWRRVMVGGCWCWVSRGKSLIRFGWCCDRNLVFVSFYFLILKMCVQIIIYALYKHNLFQFNLFNNFMCSFIQSILFWDNFRFKKIIYTQIISYNNNIEYKNNVEFWHH